MIGWNLRGTAEEPTAEPGQQRALGDDDVHELKIKVLHGSNSYDVSVPSNSTFGDLKRRISQTTGMEPQVQKLLFRGKEKDDCDPLQMAGVKVNSELRLMVMEGTREKEMNSEELEKPSQILVGGEAVAGAEVDKLTKQMQKLLLSGKEKDDCDPLQMAGVKDNSELLLMEGTREKEMNSEEMEEPSQILVGGEAVAEVRAEVDKLSKQVSALQTFVDGGNKVEDKQIVYLTEMLMRQLLKLDSIEAEGEGKMLRKQEVRRIMSLVDAIDALKARNSNPFIDCSNTVSGTTQWETFDSGAANVSSPTPVPLSTEVTQEWEQFD